MTEMGVIESVVRNGRLVAYALRELMDFYERQQRWSVELERRLRDEREQWERAMPPVIRGPGSLNGLRAAVRATDEAVAALQRDRLGGREVDDDE